MTHPPRPGDVDRVDSEVVVTYSPQPTSYTGVVAMVVVRDAGIGVFDTGVAEFMPAALLPALEQLGVTPKAITAISSTHGHFDRSGGSAALHQLSGAPVALSAHDVKLAKFIPDVMWADNGRVSIGALTFEVMATPGHTAGSVCFYEPELRLLIVGDAVQGSGSAANGLLPVYFHSGRGYRAGLRRLLELRPDTMIMGHPLEWSGEASCIHYGDRCVEMLEESLYASAVIADTTTAVLSDAALADLPTIRHEILTRLREVPLLGDFRPDEPVGASTDATVRSELRDLGVELR